MLLLVTLRAHHIVDVVYALKEVLKLFGPSTDTVLLLRLVELAVAHVSQLAFLKGDGWGSYRVQVTDMTVSDPTLVLREWVRKL